MVKIVWSYCYSLVSAENQKKGGGLGISGNLKKGDNHFLDQINRKKYVLHETLNSGLNQQILAAISLAF